MHIRVENLHKSFGKNHVLRGINVEIPAGQLCMIIGASGTGKSLLLKHLVGLMKPDSGRILIDEEDIVPLSERRMLPLRKRFGMIFQGGGLLQSMTVGENVGLGLLELNHRKDSEVRDIVREKLEVVGLEGRESQMPSTLSGGQLKRAAIARALCANAECLLFDEPTSGLDPIMADNIDEVIQSTNRDSGATTIVVTHDVASIFKIADMIHMMHEGAIIASGTPEEFRRNEDKRVQEFLAREFEEAKTMQE